jgi:hypothetical protein
MAPEQNMAKPRTFLYRRLAAGAIGILLVAGSLSAVVLATSSSPSTTTTTSSPASNAAAKTTAGPVGVVAPWVVAENKKPGTTAWQIPPAVTPNIIAGFSNLNYAAVGQTAKFYVTTPAPSFKVTAYRMGYYQNKGGRSVWTSSTYKGVVQPVCPLTAGINMVSCENWSTSFSVPITKAFVQGDYLFKLTDSQGNQGYVPLTVWDQSSKATYLFVNRTFTEEGWNFWGGYDFYQGLGPCAPTVPTYPQCNRARVVSLDRPYNTGYGASDFFGNEYPLLQYMEQHGLDVTYVTDVTLDVQPSLSSNHKVFLSLGHDETWSSPERQGAITAKGAGTNFVFFGSAAVLRHVRMQPSSLGPERIEVNYRSTQEDPLNGKGNPLDVTGNTFSSPPTSLSPVPFTGELYSGYLNGTNNVPFVVADGNAWAFKGTGLKTGSQLPGVVMSDIDHLSFADGSPKNIQVFGHSPIPENQLFTAEGIWNGFSYSDMTYYTDPAGNAGVINTGTVNWINAMSSCITGPTGCLSSKVQQITGNIFALFGKGPAGLSTPSVPNWSSIQPVGS